MVAILILDGSSSSILAAPGAIIAPAPAASGSFRKSRRAVFIHNSLLHSRSCIFRKPAARSAGEASCDYNPRRAPASHSDLSIHQHFQRASLRPLRCEKRAPEKIWRSTDELPPPRRLYRVRAQRKDFETAV